MVGFSGEGEGGIQFSVYSLSEILWKYEILNQIWILVFILKQIFNFPTEISYKPSHFSGGGGAPVNPGRRRRQGGPRVYQ